MKRILLNVLGVIVSLMLCSCTSKAKSNQITDDSDNVLGVKVPKIEAFVRVTTEEGADVFKSARADSPWRVIWLRQDEEEGEVQVDETWSDKKVPNECTAEKSVEYAGETLLLLGEEGDFWKVNIYQNYAPNLEVGYLRKSDAEMVKFEALTADMIKAPNQQKLSPTIVKTEGKYAGLVLDIGSDEAWGEEWIDVGVLVDGMIVSQESSMVTLMRDDEVKDVECVLDKESGNVLMRYPESMMMEDSDGFGNWFDPAKLNDKQIEQMLKLLSQKRKSKRVRCECRIPGNDSRKTFYLKH